MITVVCGHPEPRSSTAVLATDTGNAVATQLRLPAPQVVDIASLSYRLLVSGDVARRLAVDAVTTASLVIVATPTVHGSYPGVLKVFLDALPAGGLAGKSAVVLAAGETLSVARQTRERLTDVLTDLGAAVTGGFDTAESELNPVEPIARSFAPTIVRLQRLREAAAGWPDRREASRRRRGMSQCVPCCSSPPTDIASRVSPHEVGWAT
jgi:FMN reductase